MMHFVLRNRRRFILALMVAIAMLLTGLYFNKDAHSEAYLFDTVQRGDVENHIGATGTLEPKNYVDVGAQLSGQVKKIHVEEGDQVQAGQLLVEIDATVFETRVANAEASLEGNRAQLEQLRAELELADGRAIRNQNLHQRKAISEDALIESQTTVKILRAKIRAMEAQIKADSALLAGDRATLGYSKIYAPSTGTVVALSVREGQTLSANQNAPLLLKIADLSLLTLRAEVSEADVTNLFKGMPLYFKTFGGGERRWHSTVRQVLPTPVIINDVVLYQVLVDVENQDGLLMDAMTAHVFFLRERAHNTLLIPTGALQKAGNVWTVKVMRGSSLVATNVILGVRNRTHTQVLTGLNEGDLAGC